MRSFIRLIVRNSVDLPQPDGPISAVIRLVGMSIEMSLTARNEPYQKLRSLSRMTGGIAFVGASDGAVASTRMASIPARSVVSVVSGAVAVGYISSPGFAGLGFLGSAWSSFTIAGRTGC